MTYEEARIKFEELKKALFKQVQQQIYHETFDENSIDDLAEQMFDIGYNIEE